MSPRVERHVPEDLRNDVVVFFAEFRELIRDDERLRGDRRGRIDGWRLGTAPAALAASFTGGALLGRGLFFAQAPFGLEAGALVLAGAIGDEDDVSLQPAAFLLHRALGVAGARSGEARLTLERRNLQARAFGGCRGLDREPGAFLFAGAFSRGCRFC